MMKFLTFSTPYKSSSMRLMERKLFSGVRLCKCCGTRMLFQGYNTQNHLTYIMEKKQVCYECAFWQDIIQYPPEYLEIIDNKCLRVYPVANKKDKTLILGGKGKMRYFIRPDYSVFRSNDIWTIGTIPDRFASKFHPTAIEVTLKAYRQLQQNNKRCQARACLDRYHCFRYNLALEQETGPYNSIPANWKVGNERCRSFISFNEILSDSSNEN